MRGWLLVGVGLVILLIVIVTIIRRHGRRVTEREIIESQQIVNQAIKSALPVLKAFGVLEPKDLTSELVANIWGHNVMAFEFILPTERRDDVKKITERLDLALSDYAQANGVHAFGMQKDPLVVTDTWYDNVHDYLHIDVACVNNAQTLAYLRDLKRLNQPLF